MNAIIGLRGSKMTSQSPSKATKEVSMTVSRKCSIDKCNNTHKARGYCIQHWRKWYTHGDPNWERPKFVPKKCRHDTCSADAKAWGYCKTHAMRMWRGQDLDRETRRDPRPAIIEGKTAKIPLGIKAKDGYAIVDASNSDLATKKWNLSARGYPTTGRGTYLHHLVIGKPPTGMVVDHINRNRLDNRKKNLRFATYHENTRNISRQRNNTSGYRGVHRNAGKWVADIKVNYKKIHVGSYDDILEAAKAYNDAAVKYFGDFAVLNDIKEYRSE